MPRRKLTEQEIDDIREEGFKRIQHFARHPEEREKEHRANLERIEKARKVHMKKYGPVAIDMSYNGEYASIEFTRTNGERAIGSYKLTGWEKCPASEWARMNRKAVRFLQQEREAKQLPLSPEETPRS